MKRARRRQEVLGRGAVGLGGAGFISAVRLPESEPGTTVGYPWQLPVVRALAAPGGLPLHPGITYLVGENASGKSTLLEAIAVAAGINPEGGSSAHTLDDEPDPERFSFAARRSHQALGRKITLARTGRRWRADFFLRAESLFTVAGFVEALGGPLSGGVSLHEQSHGESFLSLLLGRFGPDGLYLLDEPEAALSTQNQLSCLRRIDELVREGSQFVIATHSPLLLAHPRARIYELSAERPPVEIAWEDTEPVRLTRAFLQDRERFVRELLSD